MSFCVRDVYDNNTRGDVIAKAMTSYARDLLGPVYLPWRSHKLATVRGASTGQETSKAGFQLVRWSR